MKFPRKLFKSIVVYLFLVLSLWWNLVRAIPYTNAQWMPKSFFHVAENKEVHLEFSVLDANLFESAFFSLVALPGHLTVTSGTNGELSSMDDWKRYLWICLTPWLITYAQTWLLNLYDFAWNMPSALDATNFKIFSFLWSCQLIVQALLWSEVFCVALQGWVLMRNAGELYSYPSNGTSNTQTPSATPRE